MVISYAKFISLCIAVLFFTSCTAKPGVVTKTSSSAIPPTPTTPPTASSNPFPAIDPNSVPWPIYTAKNEKFSIKYPTQAQATESNNGVYITYIAHNDNDSRKRKGEGMNVSINYDPNQSKKKLEDYVQEYVTNIKAPEQIFGEPIKLIVNTNPAYVVRTLNNEVHRRYFIQNKNSSAVITVNDITSGGEGNGFVQESYTAIQTLTFKD